MTLGQLRQRDAVDIFASCMAQAPSANSLLGLLWRLGLPTLPPPCPHCHTRPCAQASLLTLTASLASGLALEGDPHARLSMVWSDSSSSLVSTLLQVASCFLVSSRLRMERLSELNVGLDNLGTESPTAPRKQSEFHRGGGYIYDD